MKKTFKSIVSVILVLSMLLGMLVSTAIGVGAETTVNTNEIIISTPADLAEFAKRTQDAADLGACAGLVVKLGADIDMSGYNWYYRNAEGTVVADYRIPAFAGTLDGQGYSVKNLNYRDDYKDATDVTLLSFIVTIGNAPAVIKDITFDGVKVNTSAPARFATLADSFTYYEYKGDIGAVSGVTAKNIEVTSNAQLAFGGMFHKEFGLTNGVSDCAVINFTVNANGVLNGPNDGRCGGFIATGSETTPFTRCYVENFTVNAADTGTFLGGFIGGASMTGSFTDCEVRGFELNAAARFRSVGGFAAYTAGSAWGKNVIFNNCDVSGLDVEAGEITYAAGGFIGCVNGQSGHDFIDCTAEGSLKTEAVSGGFAGWLRGRPSNASASFENCSSAVNVYTTKTAGDFVGEFNPADGNVCPATFSGCTATGDVFALETVGSFIDGNTEEADGIIGGTYNYDPENVNTETGETNNVAPGYRALDNGDGTWTVFPDLGLEVVTIAFHRWNDETDSYENWRSVEVFKGTSFLDPAHDNANNSSHPVYRFKNGASDGIADGLAELNKDAGSEERPFTYWTTASDGNGPEDLADSTVIEGDMNVYVALVPLYTVSYVYTGKVPADAPALPASADYPADSTVTVADKYADIDGYKFYGWADPCNALANGIMPAHDVTLVGYWLPENDNIDPPIGIKTDKETDSDYQYEVTIAVPGDGDAIKTHDEVILIIDGSYSGDDEWEDMKTNIIEIGEAVLGGAGRTEITVMTFGMGDNIVVEGIKTLDELKTQLPALPGGLLYGRSSTNCEAGFLGALKYIQEKSAEGTLNEVDVVFISDGGINTDETLRAFDRDWRKMSTRFGEFTVAKATLEGAVTYGANLPEAFAKVFGNRFDGATREQILERAFGGEVTSDEFYAFAEQVWTDVYAYSGLTRGEEYPISVTERAFVKYDKENDTYVQDLFYYATYNSSLIKYPNAANRTIDAAKALDASDLVRNLYLLRYANDGRAWWMDQVNNNYYHATDVEGLLGTIKQLTTELSKTNYTDVVVTDYMSKWVILDPATVYVKNDTTGEIIWTATDGWKSETDRPTAKDPAVLIEKIDPADYEKGGADVVGNMNGDIYRLTWNVKDDCLLRTDNYSLNYLVTVDVDENGFIPGKEFPANGNTYVEYEEDGRNDIEVPEVTIPAYTVTYKTDKVILQETNDLITGTVIPSCGEPDEYTDGNYVYTFVRWDLIEGTEGEDGTVGNTDLVYLAVFEAKPIETTEPETTEPETTEPETTEPETTEPETTEPETTEPETTEPEITEPEITEPEITEPEITEPETTDEPTEEITDPQIPLAPQPPKEEPEEEYEEIEDPDVPLADVPQTGDNYACWMILSGVIACTLTTVTLSVRRREENE